ncbi:MAG: histidine phosphatase family protein [Ardenticatenaceae bacterium]|nr:histidine phosphatase family protein [Ardenticatenaceae bacterium]MCB8988866.1 histidine phosphatase family protein [Ardenticatenaceae bacterium]
MQLYIIRHAQSVNNALWAETGGPDGRLPDPPLTELGEQQAQRLAQHLTTGCTDLAFDYEGGQHRVSYDITHLYSSLMLRAVQTGHYLAEALDIPLHIWEIIHEWGGIFEFDVVTGEPRGLPGPNRSFFSERFSRLVLPHTLGDQGWWNRPYDPPEETGGRAAVFVEELLEKHGGTDDRVAIITHGGFYQALMRHILGVQVPHNLLGQAMDVWFRVNNTAVTRIDFNENHVSVAYINRIDHLPDSMIT